MAPGARQIRSFELSPAGTTAAAGGQVSHVPSNLELPALDADILPAGLYRRWRSKDG
jgi:hypothetical protein